MKQVMVEEARQSNVDLTEDDIKKIQEKIDQSSQAAMGGGYNGNDKVSSAGDKAGNEKGNSGNNNSNKANSGNANKGVNGNSKK